ncbi:hypothetical protein VQ042_14780 [Aurantimonas sp. A2-1-M11]|uniref:hypothetical protein n=1 Tax=Aurantimonas sp. A2-1-M11 TaxID=3113712 RepID=UPI002F95EA72
MKLPERFARRKGRGFHSAIVTSFAVEFAAFEEVMLPQLSIGGASNVLLIADARLVTMGLSDGSALPEALGRDYLLHSPPVADGLFHPKIVLQIGRGGGRCFVSSANVTGAGLGGNVEVVVEIECGVEQSAEREIVRAAWRYVNAIVPETAGAAREALTWAGERARWLGEPGGTDAAQTLDDGTVMALLAQPGGAGIGARFAELIGGEAVERLVLLSPYWDHDVAAIAALERSLSPGRTSILLDVDRHEFPVAVPMPPHREIIDISDWRPSRFTHAKVLIAMTRDHDHVLSGSTNCTVAALGGDGFAGSNAEASVYRRLPRGAAAAALDLDRWLAAEPFNMSDLPEPVSTTPVPLAEMQAGGAGSFETEGGRLIWRRPAGRWAEGVVALMTASDELIVELDIAGFTTDGDRLSVCVGEADLEKTTFARIRSASGNSLRGFVVHRAALRARRRESAGGSVAKALSTFDDGNDLHLWMHQAFDELSRADVEEDGGSQVGRTGPRARPEEGPASEIRFMTYEEFMSARLARRGRGGRLDSAVAGTHFDSVRALLNRLSGYKPEEGGGLGDGDDDSWMDLGDEMGELADTPERQQASEPDEPRVRPAPDMTAYDRAVRIYTDGLAAEHRSLGAPDVLRLRLWIMLILREAQCEAAPRGMPAVSDEKGWPRLIIRVVSAFFWGKRSPISRLVVSRDYEEMPVDFLECWSAVLWAIDAITAAVPAQPRTQDFLRRVPTLRAHVVLMLGLTPADLHGDVMKAHRDGLDADLGTRLGLTTAAKAA